MKCAMCGKELDKDIFVYRKLIVCHQCVMKDCEKNSVNNLYIDSYFRNVDRFMCVYNSYLMVYKRKLKDSLIKYNKTKNMLYKIDIKYYSKKIKELENLTE